VEVTVGSSPPVRVLLDTGSVGLHVFAPAIRTGPGSGVTATTTRNTITYAGGSVFTGVVADAVVTIGSQATARPVPFGLITSTSCDAAKPTCPTAAGITAAIAAGDDGILGIAMNTSGQDLASPILGMPGSLGQTWSLHLSGSSGTLVLGAPLPTGPTVTTIPLRSLGTTGGTAFWGDSSISLCVAVGTTRGCVPGLLDSGTAAVQLHGTPLAGAPVTAGTSTVTPGLPLSVSLPGAATPFWSFTTGTSRSENLVMVQAQKTPFVNLGVAGFYAFTVTYDEPAGTETLLPGG
jgi:hypothetical protein